MQKKKHIQPCPEHSLLSCNHNFMKLDRHKISDVFEFRPDRTIDSGVTCPLVPKIPILDFVRSIACLVLIGFLRKLQITWTSDLDRHKISEKLEFQQNRTIHFGVLAFECLKNPYLTLSRV